MSSLTLNVRDMVDEATAWRNKGVTAIPVVFASKRPMVKWTPWRERNPPVSLLRLWFRKAYPCNLGLVLMNDLCVVDFDEIEVYNRWCSTMPHLADSYTVSTSRGAHVYLQMMHDTGKTYAFDGGEIKGSGIVIAPPSLHSSGVVYKVLKKQRIAGVVGIDDLGLEIKHEIVVRVVDCERYATNGDSIVSRIKRANPIVDWLNQYTTVLQRMDGTLEAICPFHDDKSPSMLVFPGEARCYCFSTNCRAHRSMDVINCTALMNGISNQEAISLLSRGVG